MDIPEKVEARHCISSACHSATEFVQAMKNAPTLKAVDSNDKYKLLLEHKGVAPAGIDMGQQNEYQFAIWLHTYNGQKLRLGTITLISILKLKKNLQSVPDWFQSRRFLTKSRCWIFIVRSATAWMSVPTSHSSRRMH